MVMVCRRNPKHQPLGPARCLVPGCNSLLIEREAQIAIEPGGGLGAVPPPAPPVPRSAAPPVVPSASPPAPPPAEPAASPEVEPLRKKLDDLASRAAALQASAQQSAATAAERASTAAQAAADAGTQAAPHVSKPGFGEAARHADGTQYYATKAQEFATEAASHAAAAKETKVAIDGLLAGLSTRPGLGELKVLLGEVEQAVTLIEKVATAAQAAASKAQNALGEAGALGGFFAEAMTLWRKLHG